MLRVRSDADVQNEWVVNKLEVVVQGEGLGGSRGLSVGSGRSVYSSLGVVGYTLLEEISLALERDHIHKVEGVRRVVQFVVAKSHEESIGDELDVLTHELSVHTDEGNGEGI